MATIYELWNDDTNNLVDDYDTLEDAFDEVRWRATTHGEDVAAHLSLLRSDDGRTFVAVAVGDELVRRAQSSVTATHVAADD